MSFEPHYITTYIIYLFLLYLIFIVIIYWMVTLKYLLKDNEEYRKSKNPKNSHKN